MFDGVIFRLESVTALFFIKNLINPLIDVVTFVFTVDDFLSTV